jgi:hypothetical protein
MILVGIRERFSEDIHLPIFEEQLKNVCGNEAISTSEKNSSHNFQVGCWRGRLL